MADHDEMRNPERHDAPDKTLVDKVIELALSAGGGAVTLLSGLLAAVLILYSGYVIYDSLSVQEAASSNAWDLLRYKPQIIEETQTILNVDPVAGIGEDYRAWLTVYNTAIDYPVVQGPDDLYYAYHNIYKESSLTGAIYLAAGNSPDFSDSYNLIYGHHMDNGAMFGELDKMTGNETGLIVSGEDIYDVQFFAVATTDAYEHQIYDAGNRLDDVMDFLRSGGEGGVGVGTHVLYFNEQEAADAVKVVALSTCANANTNGRRVVFGKMVKHIVMKEITVKKVWDDANNQDGIRPSSLTVVASNGAEAVLTEANQWTAVLSVPKFDNSGEITYTWTEGRFTGYELTGNVTDGDVTTLTNTHTPAVKSLTVSKVWTDDNNRDGLRPETVTAVLSNGTRVQLNAENNWTASVENLPVFENGQEINYTWTEETPEGYTLDVSYTGNAAVLTNTHTPETTSKGVQKVWLDADNQDGIRPEVLTVTLYANDTVEGMVTLSEENEWADTIDNLYVYENGQPIVYRWEEEKIVGYELTRVTEGAVTTLENTHIPATVSLMVSKIWDDDSNRDGLRPGSLEVTLSNGQSVTLNDDNHWTASIENLPVYNAGNEIQYAWTEPAVFGYSGEEPVTAGNETIFTNRHETDKTVATVTKVWDDDNNRDGLRPENVKMTLSNGTEVTLNTANQWTATVEGLPVNENGKPVTYTWTEEKINGYTSSSEVKGTTTKITNRHAIAVTDLKVVKVWEDADNQDGIRPEEITVTLHANGEAVAEVQLNDDNQWSGELNNYPVNRAGQKIVYTWTESRIPGYTLSTATDPETAATILTNTHKPDTVNLTVKKVWDDKDNQDGIRPAQLTVSLKDNGTEIRTVTLSADGQWTGTVEDLPVNRNGSPILYTWTEIEPEGYRLTGIVTEGTTTTLTNSHTPATTSQSVSKVWADDGDRDRLRPSTLDVTLQADGNDVGHVTLNSANGWSAQIDNLPVNKAGNPIVYTWAEETPAGYVPDSQKQGTETVLTNTHTPASIQLTVQKKWNDDSNRDGLRPDKLVVTLWANRKEFLTAELNEANAWKTTVEVPLNDDPSFMDRAGHPRIYRGQENRRQCDNLHKQSRSGTYNQGCIQKMGRCR